MSRALFQMATDETPGSDGLPVLFFQNSWATVEKDVTRFCLGVLNEGSDLSCLNHTLIKLANTKGKFCPKNE